MSATTLDFAIKFNSSEVMTEAEAPTAGSPQDRTIRQSNRSIAETLGAATTPAITAAPAITTLTMTGSAVTLDLTAAVALAMPAAATRTVDYTTKKIVAFMIKPRKTNAGAVNVAPGGSNPYLLFGSGNDIDLAPGQVIGCCFDGIASGLAAVSSTVKNIAFTGTSGDLVDILFFA